MIPERKLDFWLENEMNVLFEGQHGVGKTSMIKAAFERAGLKWKYFSASTMDPWVDFIGVPREVSDEKGEPYLDLIRPREFRDDEVEALFFDEFNRSHKKVRNAVMELIQFKSINGRKFDNLKVVWAAINPDDPEEGYDVEPLDPAQIDRFHIKVEMPYKPDIAYFTRVYGEEWANAAVTWWNDLPSAEKKKVSPRRLDYALSFYRKKGDLRDILPKSSNVGKLVSHFTLGDPKEKLKQLMQGNDATDIKKFLASEKEYSFVESTLKSDVKLRSFFMPHLPAEKLASFIKGAKERNAFLKEMEKAPELLSSGRELFKSGADMAFVSNLAKKMKEEEFRKVIFPSDIEAAKAFVSLMNKHAGQRDVVLADYLIIYKGPDKENPDERVQAQVLFLESYVKLGGLPKYQSASRALSSIASKATKAGKQKENFTDTLEQLAPTLLSLMRRDEALSKWVLAAPSALPKKS